MNYCYEKGVQNCILCWEAVPISEGPLSEVPLHLFVLSCVFNIEGPISEIAFIRRCAFIRIANNVLISAPLLVVGFYWSDFV